MVLGQFFCPFTGSAAQLERTACARHHGPQLVGKKFLEEEIFTVTNFRELPFDCENRENFPLYGSNNYHVKEPPACIRRKFLTATLKCICKDSFQMF